MAELLLKEDQFILNISENYQEVCKKVTEKILAFSNEKIAIQQRFTIVLSGDLELMGVYQLMARAPYRDKFQWKKIHFFFSNEKWLPREDQKSNYRMVSKALFTKVKISSKNIHPIHTMNCTPQSSASMYEEDISSFFELKNDELPRFDLFLLGLGCDGHTASLFPGNSALLVKDHLVTDVYEKSVTEERVTLTLPVINHADMIIFAVCGGEKAMIVSEVLESDEVLENKESPILPADEVSPSQGELCWFLDKDAATRLMDPDILLKNPKRIGIAADHAGYQLKEELSKLLREANFEVVDYGDHKLNLDDDYPDFVVPLARAVSSRKVDRGVAICGSGVGVSIAANKVVGVRACLINDAFSARQGVEDDNMNVICLGSIEINKKHAWEFVSIFLASHFSGAQRHQRRLAKVAVLENSQLKGR